MLWRIPIQWHRRCSWEKWLGKRSVILFMPCSLTLDVHQIHRRRETNKHCTKGVAGFIVYIHGVPILFGSAFIQYHQSNRPTSWAFQPDRIAQVQRRRPNLRCNWRDLGLASVHATWHPRIGQMAHRIKYFTGFAPSHVPLPRADAWPPE